jgi:ketosteroid isomerase-like protein
MTTETPNVGTVSARQQILAVLEDRAAAITAKDARRALARCSPDVVAFDLAPPLQTAGAQALDPAGLEWWFGTWDGPIGYDVGELTVAAEGAVAFSYGLTHLHGTKTDGEKVDLWFRSTIGLSLADGSWRIVHEHSSTPFYMDGSGKAALDLRP